MEYSNLVEKLTSIITEFGMGIGRECFCVLDHVFHRAIRAVGCSVVHIHAFKLYIEGTDVLSVETDYILSNIFNFLFVFFIFLLLFWLYFVNNFKAFDN